MKRQKLYYVPGLISLLFLPGLLLFIPLKEKKPLTVLTHYLPKDEKPENSGLSFTKHAIINQLAGKKVITIQLDFHHSNYEKNISDRQLRFITNEIERLAFTRDTTTVLKVELNYDNTYRDFVWLINLTIIYNILLPAGIKLFL